MRVSLAGFMELGKAGMDRAGVVCRIGVPEKLVQKGRGTGKIEGDETRVFQLECPSCLHGQGIA